MSSVSKKVKKLLDKMTIDEKIEQLSCTIPMTFLTGESVDLEKLSKVVGNGVGRMTQFATGFLSGPESAARGYNEIQKYHVEKTRLGIPVLMQNESAVGLVAKDASIFPVPIAIASTWEPILARKMGQIISDEAKAIGVRKGLSPVSDIARDARWGRVGESFGEDPMLVTQFSIEKVKGMQGSFYGDNIIACAKHFMGYGMSERGINAATVNIGKKELFEVHGTPFAGMIKHAGLQSVMATYSSIDGVPMSVNEYYLNKVLKEDMEFKGSVICDAGSIHMPHTLNGMFKDKKESACAALKAGIDADTPITDSYHMLKEAIEAGSLDINYLNQAVERVLTQKYELGLFDNPYVDIQQAKKTYEKQEGQKLALEIAEKELVLLKNNGILPLHNKYKKIAIIGPFADRLNTLFGGYAYPSFVEMIMCAASRDKTHMIGISEYFEKIMDIDYVRKILEIEDDKSYEYNLQKYLRKEYNVETLLERMKSEFIKSEIVYARGTGKDGIEEALSLSKDADVIITTLGEVTGFGIDATSGEGVNNYNLDLPEEQESLLHALCKLGKPVILILFNGRPLTINFADQNCDAIIEAWYPGQFGAEVITNVLSGKVNPSGKLPITFPRTNGQCPIYYGHKPIGGYRNTAYHSIFNKEELEDKTQSPLYHFGHGLSYTTFTYSDLQTVEEINTGEKFEVSIYVENTGDVYGEEIVQVYTQTLQASVERPVMELRGFKRVPLQAKESKKVTFKFDTKQFGYFNSADKFVLEPTHLRVLIGSDSLHIREEKEIKLSGDVIEILHDRVFEFEADFE